MNFLHEKDVFHNVKVKHYGIDDYKQIIVASQKIFKSDSWELSKKEKSFKIELEEEVETKETEKTEIKEVRADSVKRAKTAIFDIAMLNDFSYFVTWTLDSKLISRYDIAEIKKKLCVFLQNKVNRNNLKYLVVGEQHKDGAIHFHGLVAGDLKMVDSGHKDKKGNIIYNMPQWKYGFSTAIALYGDRLHTSKYIVKYIQKDFKKLFGKFYFAGGDINRKPEITFTDVPFDEVEGKVYKPELSPCAFKYMDEIMLRESV